VAIKPVACVRHSSLDEHNLPLLTVLAVDEGRIVVLFSLRHQETEADELPQHLDNGRVACGRNLLHLVEHDRRRTSV
jgi:hypothetical protein